MTNSQTPAEIESTNRMRETEEILLEASKVLRDEHTHTYKNIPLSGFLHRHESSIDLRERQVLVTGWLQSHNVRCWRWKSKLARLGLTQRGQKRWWKNAISEL